jgi:hypothetical protein
MNAARCAINYKTAQHDWITPPVVARYRLNGFLKFRPTIRRRYAPGAAHRHPVILVLCSANKADLVVLPIRAAMRP